MSDFDWQSPVVEEIKRILLRRADLAAVRADRAAKRGDKPRADANLHYAQGFRDSWAEICARQAPEDFSEPRP